MGGPIPENHGLEVRDRFLRVRAVGLGANPACDRKLTKPAMAVGGNGEASDCALFKHPEGGVRRP